MVLGWFLCAILYKSGCASSPSRTLWAVDKSCPYSRIILTTAHRVLDGDDAHPDLYKIAHKNHPSTIWTRSSSQHYDWLFRLFRMVSAEYSIRYSKDTFKVHTTWNKLGKLLENLPKNIKDNGWTNPPQCMPDYCKKPDTVDAYRNYYLQEKAGFAKWNYTNQPKWWM